jgi:Fe-S cluster biogenesis protein NfuA
VSVAPDEQGVSDALAPLRAGFEADGAGLAVDAASAERVVVRLVLNSATCADCIVSPPILERMISMTLHSRFPELGRVEVVDPRL